MSDHPYTDEDEYLIQATLQLLESRHKNYSQCMSCGEPMLHSPVLICGECLGHQCDVFEKIAELPETEKDAQAAQEEDNKETNDPRE